VIDISLELFSIENSQIGEKVVMKRKNTIDAEDLRNLSELSLDMARTQAISMISSKTNPKRLFALKFDISQAPTSKEVQRIMYNVLLAGEGLITTNSTWDKRFKGG